MKSTYLNGNIVNEPISLIDPLLKITNRIVIGRSYCLRNKSFGVHRFVVC